ncbi:MAG: hypothetical protein IJA87_05245 [Clostridia bacterium]|nr:hypothetical protein [Clostridia bacterium]
MKSERLLYALEDINDEYIEQAAPKHKKKANKIWIKVCAVAACVAVTVAAGLGLFFDKEKHPPVELPVLTLGNIFEGGMSMEAHWAYSADELISSNPWTEEKTPESLPVYKNSVYTEDGNPDYNAKQMKNILLEYAAKLGINMAAKDIKETVYDSFYGYYIESGNIRIELNIWMMLNVEISGEDVLPSGYTLDRYASFDELKKTAEYLKKEYADFLGMSKPVADISLGDYDVYGRRNFSLSFYDGAGDAENQIENYNFGKVHFRTDENGSLHISRSCSKDEIIGVYPIITADEALNLLQSGNYVTSVGKEFGGKEKIKKVELIYHNSNLSEISVPYYRFYVEIENEGNIAEELPGIKTYGTYYVPAVKSEYISDMPLWNGGIN